MYGAKSDNKRATENLNVLFFFLQMVHKDKNAT